MRRLILLAVVAAVFGFLFLPIVIVVLTSFSASPIMSFPPTGFTVRWYRNLSPDFVRALGVSLTVGLTSALVSTLIGTSCAIGLARSGNRILRSVVGFLTSAPLTVPHVVLGIGLLYCSLFFWDLTGLAVAGTMPALVMSHVVVCVPYVVRSVLTAHSHFDGSIEEAGLNAGASRWRVFSRISLPILLPGIVSGAFFAFLVSFDEVPISIFMGGTVNTTTLPLKILTSIEYDMSPTIMSFSSIVIVASMAVMVLFDRLIGLERFLGSGRA